MTSSISQPFFSTDLEQDALEQILQRIDENLALRPLLQQPPHHQESTELVSPPCLPDLSHVPFRLRRMREIQAPIFLTQGGGLVTLIKRLLNLPIRLFGHKQIGFNRDLLDVLDMMIVRLQTLDDFALYQAQIGEHVIHLLTANDEVRNSLQQAQTRQEEIAEQLGGIDNTQHILANDVQQIRREITDLLEMQAKRIDELNEEISQVTDLSQGQAKRIDELSEGYSQRVEAQQNMTQQVVGIGAAINEQQKNLDELEGKQQGLQTELSRLAASLDEQPQVFAGLTEELQQQITSLNETHNHRIAQLADAHDRNVQQIEQVQTEINGIPERITYLAAEGQIRDQWLEQLANNHRGQHEWVELIQRKLELLMLDMREWPGSPLGKNDQLPVPRIVDSSAYKQLLASMGDQVKANLGCGEKVWPGYINVDLRELREVDVVADIRRLPFELGSVAELASAHLIEHFREHQLRTRILPYWQSLLMSEGSLRIICPNWSAMLEKLTDGSLSLADFKRLTFGAQDYEGNDHQAMYTPDTLQSLLNECGFSRVEIIETERMNHICPEMELRAFV